MSNHPSDPDTESRSSSEELAQVDDAVIGRALRWSAIALALVLAVGAAIFFALREKPAPAAHRITALSAPAKSASEAQIPAVKFTDVTAAAGIDFIHNTGAYGAKLLPETMGAGVAFFDYDAD